MSEGEEQAGKSPAHDVVGRRAEAAGFLAAGLAGEVARPSRVLRQQLAVLVDRLDQYMATATGPNALPWEQVDELRQELADAYLQSRRLARLTSELYRAVDPGQGVAEIIDVSKVIETALNLVRHRIAEDTEVFVDLGSGTEVRAVVGDLVLAIANMLNLAADSSTGVNGGAISIKTTKEVDEVVVYVADNGRGRPDQVTSAIGLALAVAEVCGGRFEGASEAGRGSVFEMRLPVASRL